MLPRSFMRDSKGGGRSLLCCRAPIAQDSAWLELQSFFGIDSSWADALLGDGLLFWQFFGGEAPRWHEPCTGSAHEARAFSAPARLAPCVAVAPDQGRLCLCVCVRHPVP